MEQYIFLYLSITLVGALIAAFSMRILRQPLIIGYIIAGIVLGAWFSAEFPQEVFSTFSQFSTIGVAFLLFIVGLHLNPRIVKEIGGVAFVTGIGQVVFTSIIGFGLAISLGFSMVASLYISIALTFSSTIIITKLLSDKGDLDKLYGKISIGFLIVQDLIAIVILMGISSFSESFSASLIFWTIGKGFLLLIGVFLFSKILLKKFVEVSSKSQELLFIFSVSWCFILASLFWYFGFSLEIGALLAGITLSTSNYHSEIHSKIKPLRDFFIVMFFIHLGLTMGFSDILNSVWPSVLFSIFILIGNPLIVMILMGVMGYTSKTGFLAGLTVAQISEFSLIVIALGIKMGHISSSVLSLITLTGIITIAGSAYLIMYSDRIYNVFRKPLSIFERKHISKEKCVVCNIKGEIDTILFGYNRIGYSVLQSLKEVKSNYAVFDFNPNVIKGLIRRKIGNIYGDASDVEMLEDLKLKYLKLAVSTIPEPETNLLIIRTIRGESKKCIIIVIADQVKDALELYKAGADYVIMPHFLGGDYIKQIIEKNRHNSQKYAGERKKHLKHLKERLREGHEHPVSEGKRLKK